MSTTYTEIELDPYLSVEVNRLVQGVSLPFDVFLKDRSLVIPLFNRGTVYDGTAQNILREKGIRTVYVRTADGRLLDNYLSQMNEQRRTAPDPETFTRYVAEKERNYLIDRALLIPGTKITFSLYLLHNFELLLLVEASEQAPRTIEESVLHAAGDIVIGPADIPRYHAYLDSLFTAEATKEKDRNKIKSVVIKENAKLILKGLIDEPRSGEKIKESITVVNKMVDNVLENKDAVYDLLSLRTHDYYTYTHSVNVAVLSIGLAMAVGLKRAEIEKLGIGAMLHDLGKSAIPLSIINKTSRLTDQEYAVIKTHVTEGAKLLRANKDIPPESFAAVLEHHERLSGKGYPYNKTDKDIHLFGRIASVVDCYDALTTERTYQSAHTPFYALSVLTRQAGEYDPDILKIFIKMLGELKE